MDRLRRHVPVSKRFKLGVDEDAQINIGLNSSTKPLVEYDIDKVLNVDEIFNEERKTSKCYRFSGRLNVITANELTPDAVSGDWDILFDGNPSNTPNNWVLQITHPVESDKNFMINARVSGSTVQSRAELGPQFYEIVPTAPNGSDLKVGVKGIQEHKLSEGDFVYIYDTSSVNIYQGIHKVLTVGINGENEDTSFTLDADYQGNTSSGNYKRVLNVSTQDLNFSNSIEIVSITSSGIDGNTTGSFLPSEVIFTLINSANKHSLTKGEYIDIRGVGVLNGMYKVVEVVDDYRFTIELTVYTTKGQSTTFSNPRPRYRFMNGTPSEYYVRYFEVLTSNDYETYKAGYSSSIYPNSLVNEFGVANDTWLYHYNEDVNLGKYTDNRGGEVSEVYLAIIKRSGSNTFPWSNVTADWEFNEIDSNTLNGIETISVYNASGVGTIQKGDVGDRYVGDYVEYNRATLKEITISEIIHRFGLNATPNDEGYYHKPFKKFQLRVYSDVIETAEPNEVIIGIPNNFELYPDGSTAWRDLLDIGIFEPTNDIKVNYPFVNGCHYYYKPGHIFVRRQDPMDKIDQSGVITIEPKDLC